MRVPARERRGRVVADLKPTNERTQRRTCLSLLSEKEETERSEVTVHAAFLIELLRIERVLGKRGRGRDALILRHDLPERRVDEALGDGAGTVGGEGRGTEMVHGVSKLFSFEIHSVKYNLNTNYSYLLEMNNNP